MGDTIFEIEKCFLNRTSLREYSKIQINDKTIDYLISLGLTGPKAGGIDCVKVIKINEEDQKKTCYKGCFYQEFILEAPTLLLICVDQNKLAIKYNAEWLNNFACQNASIVAQNIIIAATALGIGSCWVGTIRKKFIKEAMHINEVEPWVLLALGYNMEV